MKTYKFISKINGTYVFAADGQYYSDGYCDDEIIKSQGITVGDEDGLTPITDGEIVTLAKRIEAKNRELSRLSIIAFTAGDNTCAMQVVINESGIAGEGEKSGSLWELTGMQEQLLSIGDDIV